MQLRLNLIEESKKRLRYMEFIRLQNDREQIQEMSDMASDIVREHYDPIIGKEQNDYMIALFQSPDSIRTQLSEGANYFFVRDERNIGFLSFYLKGDILYLSKFYLYKAFRGKGYSKQMTAFLVKEARENGCNAIELNVNRSNPAIKAYEHLGFNKVREEKNDIGNGFVMDDFVYRLEVDM